MSLPLRVLLLEDLPPDAELLVAELRRAGYAPDWQRVETEADFLSALHPSLDLIIADYSLPHFSGLRALQLLQARGLDIPLLIISGTVGEDTAVAAMHEGAADYLLKDRLARLGPAVARALDQRRLRAEKEAAQTALAASEHRFRALIETSSDVIGLQDAEARLLYISDSVQRVYGYTPDELLGRQPFEFVHPEDLATVGACLQEALRSPEKVLSSEFRTRHKSGAWRWTEATIHNQLDTPGVCAVVVNFRDITERKQADEALRVSEARLRTIVEGEPECVKIVSSDGRLLEMNRAGLRMIEAETETEVFGKPVNQLIHPDDRTAFGELHRRASRGENGQLEFRIVGLKGTVRWMEAHSAPLRDASGAITSVLSVTRDITERKRADAALAASEERYRLLFEKNPLPMWVYDSEFLRFLAVNQAAVEHYGYSRDEFLTMTVEDIRPLNEPPRLGTNAAEPIGARERFGSRRHRKKDGALIDVEIIMHDIAFDGRPARLVLAQDITERVQHQREMQAIAAMAGALRAASNRAEMLPAILDQLSTLLNAGGAALAVLDHRTGESVFELARGEWAHAIGTRIAPGEGITGRMLVSGLPYVTEDVSQDPDNVRPDLHAELKAAACLPLVAHNETLGALWLGRRTPFGDGEVRLLRAVGDMAANAIRRATLHEQTTRRAEQLAAINALGRALAGTLDLPQIYARLADAVVHLLPDLSGAIISRYDAERQTLTAVHVVADGVPSNAELPVVRIRPDGRGPQTEAIHTRRPVIVADLPARIEQMSVAVVVGEPGTPPQSGLYVPMISKGKVIGTVLVQSSTRNRFDESDAEILAFVANAAAIAMQNATLFDDLRQRLEQLQALHTIDNAIGASMDLRVVLDVLLQQVTRQLNVHAACVLLLRPALQSLEYAAGQGFRSRAIQASRLRLGEDNAGRAALERRPVLVPDLNGQGGEFARRTLLAEERFVFYFAVPLLAKGQLRGVLEVFHREPLNPGDDWRNFLETLAGAAAIAIDNAELFENLQRSNSELALAYDNTLEGWARALELRDEDTEGHTRRVTEMAVQLARALGMSNAELVHLRRGALLHDIGKMGVPDAILRKPGPLTEEEWHEMRCHPKYAFDMLTEIGYLRSALDIPYAHHERWDGSGYPRGLKGAQIPLAARIFAVVDVWDALRSDRPYRSAWPEAKILEHLRAEAGRHFDPAIVEAFLRILGR